MRTHPALVALSAVAGLFLGVLPGSTHAAPDPASGNVQQVLLISVDALNPKALKRLGPALTPNFHRLMAEGAGTKNARTLYERTETLPNHTAMLTGQRSSLPGGTGVSFNADNGRTLRDSAGRYVAGAFDVVHDNGGSTAMYVAKDKFRFLDRSWDATHGAEDETGPDNGRDKVDRFVYDDAREGVLVKALTAQLLDKPATFSFLHLAATDRVGHAYGGMSPRYLKAVRRTDRLLGKVLATIDSVPSLQQHLLVVLTADHGTAARSHADPTQRANYRVPFYAWGAGVQEGADLYALNPTFVRPGKGRPGYTGAQPIRNGDVANLVTHELGLPDVPGSEFRTMGLR